MAPEYLCHCQAFECHQKRLKDGTPGRILRNYKVYREHRIAENTRINRGLVDHAYSEAIETMEGKVASREDTEGTSRVKTLISAFSAIYEAASALRQSFPSIPEQPPTHFSQIDRECDNILRQEIAWNDRKLQALELERQAISYGSGFRRSDVRTMYEMTMSMVQDCIADAGRGFEYWSQARLALEIHLKEKLPVDPSSVYDSESHFDIPLATANPILQLTVFMVVAGSLILRLPRRGANWLFAMIALIVSECLGQSHKVLGAVLPVQWTRFIQTFPKDLPTATKQFNIRRTSTVFAACPSCSFLHPPQTNEKNQHFYPATCSNRIGIKSNKRCGSELLRPKVIRGKTVLIPIKSFISFDLKDWMAELLSRPGYEEKMDRSWERLNSNAFVLKDVFDGDFLQGFLGVDGKHFGCTESEGRYVLALCFDFFNPLGNKESGIKISVGVLLLICLNLPPEERYKPENIFLAGIVPGPSEPKVLHMGNYLTPLVDSLLQFWEGVYFTRTFSRSLGRLVKLALVLIVCDLQAARKIAALGSGSHTFFCSRCLCNAYSTEKGMGNVDMASWEYRTQENMLQWANRHKEAENQTSKDAIFAASGVRWSQLYRLPYLDLPKMLVVDPMHNLYLGLLMQHFRYILGYNSSDNERKAAEKKVERSRNKAPEVFKVPTIIHNPRNPPLIMGSSDQVSSSKLLNRLRYPLSAELAKSGGIDSLTKKWAKAHSKGAFTYVVKGLVSDLGEKPKHTTEDLARMLLAWRARQIEQVDGRQDQIDSENHYGTVLSLMDTKEVWKDIRRTTKPSWVTFVPTVAGTVHGTLKADQWRVLGTLYLPVTLIRLWSNTNEGGKHLSRCLDLTMDLVSAVIIASSRTITRTSINRYAFHMTRYLTNLQVLFPLYEPHPNHHMAMHIHEFMSLFGPTHSWWCFPMERVIGQLQRLNSNYKEGEYEGTLAYAYTEQANLRAFMAKAPDPLQGAAKYFEKLIRPQTRNNSSDIVSFFSSEYDDDEGIFDLDNHEELGKFSFPGQPGPLGDAYVLAFRDLQASVPSSAVKISQLIVGGVRYTTRRTHEGNSQVLVAGDTPVVIEDILQCEDSQIYIFVRAYVPYPREKDPYVKYPILNARLWSTQLLPEYQILTPRDLGPQYAKCTSTWINEEVAVIVSLNKDWLE